jgi:hypothetical protein
MKKTLNIFLSVLAAIMLFATPSRAAIQTDSLYQPMSIVTLVILLCSVVCLVWSFKVLSLVRGGLLSKSWQMFVLGFGFLLLAQVISLGQQIALINFPGFITTTFYLLMAVTWLVGIYQTRRVLG